MLRRARHFDNFLQVAGNWSSSAERYEKCVFSSTVGWIRPKTRDMWLNVSHDAGSALIHDLMVHAYRFDCYSTSHCTYGNLASIMGA